jgi:hypothetical protein
MMAKCGMCKKCEMGKLNCSEGHNLKYPLQVNEHDCPDYIYDESGEIVKMTLFNIPEFEYCTDCAHHFNGVCDGKRLIPFKKYPRCEFFRDKNLTCKNAIPYLQYGNGLRNNHCKLPASERKTDANRGDDWCCPIAHMYDSMACYVPIQKLAQLETEI